MCPVIGRIFKGEREPRGSNIRIIFSKSALSHCPRSSEICEQHVSAAEEHHYASAASDKCIPSTPTS